MTTEDSAMRAWELHSAADLLAALRSDGDRVAAFFRAIPEERFFAGSDTDWSPAHHAEHLALAHTTVARGLRAGGRLPVHASGVSRTYVQVRDTYRATLAATPAAFLRANPFAPTIHTGSGARAVVQRYEDAHALLCAAAGSWSETELDARAVSHPLLGPLSMREMLYFMLYHDAHHAAVVAAKLAPASGT
jgi:hypothetical protein